MYANARNRTLWHNLRPVASATAVHKPSQLKKNICKQLSPFSSYFCVREHRFYDQHYTYSRLLDL